MPVSYVPFVLINRWNETQRENFKHVERDNDKSSGASTSLYFYRKYIKKIYSENSTISSPAKDNKKFVSIFWPKYHKELCTVGSSNLSKIITSRRKNYPSKVSPPASSPNLPTLLIDLEDYGFMFWMKILNSKSKFFNLSNKIPTLKSILNIPQFLYIMEIQKSHERKDHT